jgi:hypothetical protein
MLDDEMIDGYGYYELYTFAEHVSCTLDIKVLKCFE